MKNIKISNITIKSLLAMVSILFIGCQLEFNDKRELSADAVPATYAKTAEIFTDNVIGMGTNFYFPYGPDATNLVGSKLNAWTVDNQVSYKGTSSMRFDVPTATDPTGNYAGAIFRVDGAGRDLSGYDALTFYVKASQGVTIAEFGFGEDFYPNRYITTIKNIDVGTNWQKVIIPIPDASKLVNERGMFRYAASSQGTNNLGYVFWIDDLKFEKLGTIATRQVIIMNGLTVTENTLVGVKSTIKDLKYTFNMPNGKNQDVFAKPSYLTFTSSNPAIVDIDIDGVVTSKAVGTTTISANLKSTNAVGSLIINCTGQFIPAPTPTQVASNVISIYSDNYNNVPVKYTNGNWAPYQTTTSSDFIVGTDKVLNYGNFNFVGIEFSAPTINATTMTNFHCDVFIPNSFISTANFKIKLIDFGADGTFGGTGVNADITSNTLTYPSSTFTTGTWKSFDIPFASFSSLTNRSHLAQIVFEATGISNIYVDNIYLHN